LGCLFVLLANGAGTLAQGQQQPPQDKQPAPDGQMRLMISTPQEGQPKIIINGQPGGDGDVFFYSSEMRFDGQVVKGAPYSAEAVTESVQPLADGNRIVQRSTALLYRDSEGRTRRDQTLNNVGPFATGGETPRLIFINDPVSGANYVLDSRSHTARKETMFAYNFRTPDDRPGAPPPPMILREGPAGEPPGPPPAGMGEGGPRQPPPPGTFVRHEAVTRVQPVYPPIARAAGAQGLVSVQVVIDEQGNVTSARAVSGHPLLQQAAVDAARQWVFKPTIVNGKPAKVNGAISFSFTLSDKDEAAQPPAPPPPPKFPRTKESLGRQSIEGVMAEGTRETVTIPAGAVGNERAINVVTERWYSPELQTVVMTRHSDPRFGETTFRLTNINRSEPAASLFEVPPDFEVKTGGQGRGEFKLRRRQNDQ
jgi:TonB family protein